MSKIPIGVAGAEQFIGRQHCGTRCPGRRIPILADAETRVYRRWGWSLSLPAYGMKLDWNLGALADGLRCYRSQEFFLAHEHWESVWLKCEEPEKSFLQALIQMAAAFHHLQRNNSAGAASLLAAALRKLERYPARFDGVEVRPLRDEIEVWLEVLEAKNGFPSFPQIQIGFRPE